MLTIFSLPHEHLQCHFLFPLYSNTVHSPNALPAKSLNPVVLCPHDVVVQFLSDLPSTSFLTPQLHWHIHIPLPVYLTTTHSPNV